MDIKKYRNTIEYQVHGDLALFPNPDTQTKIYKDSYQIPTYEALKSITENIYWKPTIIWVVDAVRIMNLIRIMPMKTRPFFDDEILTELSQYNYLYDVTYQVRAHFVFDMSRDDLKDDRNENKHHNLATRYNERGGRRPVCLGSRECKGYTEACKFGEGDGYYDDSGDLTFPKMFYRYIYDNGQKKMTYWKNPIMTDGYIVFPKNSKK